MDMNKLKTICEIERHTGLVVSFEEGVAGNMFFLTKDFNTTSIRNRELVDLLDSVGLTSAVNIFHELNKVDSYILTSKTPPTGNESETLRELRSQFDIAYKVLLLELLEEMQRWFLGD